MHPNQIWGNDDKYNKDVQMAFRKKCEEQQKQWEKQRKQHIAYIQSLPEEQRPGYLTKWAKEQYEQGKITNPFIQKWLEGEIMTARIALIVGIIATVLIKGQVIIWIIMYIAYRCRVKRIKEEAYKGK